MELTPLVQRTAGKCAGFTEPLPTLMSFASPPAVAAPLGPARRTLADRAYARLRQLLIAGQLAPGERLSARELAQRFAMSPMPVRAAIERLAADGALAVRPQSGAWVPLMTRARFIELRSIRVALEGMAVAHAADRMTERELARLRAHHLRFSRAAARARPDPAVAIRANQQLHFTIYAAARMPVLMALIEGLWLQIGPVLNLDLRSGTQRLRVLAAHQHHAHLVLALERRDATAARRALVGDIESAAEYILSLNRLPD